MIQTKKEKMRILVFAPHNDDEVLGVGGTIAKYASYNHDVYVCEITSGNNQERVKKIQNEALKAHKILGVKETFFLGFSVVELNNCSTIELNAAIGRVVKDVAPEIAFIPHKGDLHIDHLVVSRSAMVALRPIPNPQLKSIFAYETLSETEWNLPTIDNAFMPNVWNEITDTIDLKIEAMKCFESQLLEFPHPRSLKAIRSLSEFRGSTIGVSNAESFMLIRNRM